MNIYIYNIMSYHIISYHIISYRSVAYRIISYRIVSYHIISESYHIIISYHIYTHFFEDIHWTQILAPPGPLQEKRNPQHTAKPVLNSRCLTTGYIIINQLCQYAKTFSQGTPPLAGCKHRIEVDSSVKHNLRFSASEATLSTSATVSWTSLFLNLEVY